MNKDNSFCCQKVGLRSLKGNCPQRTWKSEKRLISVKTTKTELWGKWIGKFSMSATPMIEWSRKQHYWILRRNWLQPILQIIDRWDYVNALFCPEWRVSNFRWQQEINCRRTKHVNSIASICNLGKRNWVLARVLFPVSGHCTKIMSGECSTFGKFSPLA